MTKEQDQHSKDKGNGIEEYLRSIDHPIIHLDESEREEYYINHIRSQLEEFVVE